MADLMEMRREIMQSQWITSLLPKEYQRLEYVETVGSTSWIDTGIAGNDLTIKIDFCHEILSDNVSYSPIMGNYTNEETACFRMIRASAEAKNRFLFTLNNRKSGSSFGITIQGIDSVVNHKFKTHIEYAMATIEFQGTLYSSYPPDLECDLSTRNIAIGAASPQSGKADSHSSNRFYDSIKIEKQGSIVRNYVPCYRKVDNIAGFYDTINRTFNPSMGTSEFIPGPEVSIWT